MSNISFNGLKGSQIFSRIEKGNHICEECGVSAYTKRDFVLYCVVQSYKIELLLKIISKNEFTKTNVFKYLSQVSILTNFTTRLLFVQN